MKTHNPGNERIKRQYFTFLKEAKQQSEASVDAVAKALARFEASTKYRDFKAFNYHQAVAFKHHLADRNSLVTGGKLSKATQYATLNGLKAFFQWLATQPGFRSHVKYTDAAYFNLSEKDSRIATARRQRPVPTLEQVKHTLALMPATTEIEQRDRAVMAFALLTGARDAALASFKLKHVDLVAGCVHQDARDVKTKFAKTFTTVFFPVGDEVRQIVADWVNHLRSARLWGNDDPLFPKTAMGIGPTKQFEATGLSREHWSTATPIRITFKAAFSRAGLPYFNPHSFRSTLVMLGEACCKSPEEFKAWSQNLGHEGVLTTFYSYGAVSPHRQAEIINALGASTNEATAAELAVVKKMLQLVRESGVSMR